MAEEYIEYGTMTVLMDAVACEKEGQEETMKSSAGYVPGATATKSVQKPTKSTCVAKDSKKQDEGKDLGCYANIGPDTEVPKATESLRGCEIPSSWSLVNSPLRTATLSVSLLTNKVVPAIAKTRILGSLKTKRS